MRMRRKGKPKKGKLKKGQLKKGQLKKDKVKKGILKKGKLKIWSLRKFRKCGGQSKLLHVRALAVHGLLTMLTWPGCASAARKYSFAAILTVPIRLWKKWMNHNVSAFCSSPLCSKFWGSVWMNQVPSTQVCPKRRHCFVKLFYTSLKGVLNCYTSGPFINCDLLVNVYNQVARTQSLP